MDLQGVSVLAVRDIAKSYGNTRALDGVTFEVTAGEIVAILGPSGSGKSTLLEIIAGLETPDRGEVLWEGKSLAGTPPHARGFGMMFQDFALFPHLNVFDNVAFGLKMAHLPRAEIEVRVKEALALVGLPDFDKRDVNTLSGGEQQRVALARSLAPRPRLLMLDEPLGSLDRNLRERLVFELRDILRGSYQTALYVTHDLEEAFTLAHQVVVMNAGQVEQMGTSQEIYRHPVSEFVARFVGLSNLLPGTIRQRDGRSVVETAIGAWPLPEGSPGKNGQAVTALLRPDSVRVGDPGICQMEGIIQEVAFRGSTYRAVISVQNTPLIFDFLTSEELPESGSRVCLQFDPTEALQVFFRQEE